MASPAFSENLPDPEGSLDKETFLEAAAATAEPAVPTSGFCVSVTRNGKHRKLHSLQLCGFVPGTHYREWVWHGDKLPEEADFDSVCRRCLPSGPPALEEQDLEGSCSSSSSADEEPAAQRPRIA